MPEIPEMETYRSMLNRTVTGKAITAVTVERERSINTAVPEFCAAVTGQLIERISRRAKHLIFHLSGGVFLLAHMMLDGRLFYGPHMGTSEVGMGTSEVGMGTSEVGMGIGGIGIGSGGSARSAALPGKPHVVFRFNDDNGLFFCDLRLGFLHLLNLEGLEAELAGLGVEPLGPEFTWQVFSGLLERRRGVIKPLLMDQKLVAGIGNAYSNEILFAAGIMPDRTVPDITGEEMRRLWQTIPRVLQAGIQNGGYIEEPYAEWDKVSGGHIPHFMVYDRGGEPCKVCGTVIQETKLNGRRTFYCKVCQR